MSTIWNVVRTNIVWTIGAGRTTDFWRDPWIDEVGPLADYIPVTALATIGPSHVASMVDDTGQWKWNDFTFSNAPGNFGNICDRTKAMVASLDRSTRLLRPIRPAHGGAAIGQGQWSLPQHQWLKGGKFAFLFTLSFGSNLASFAKIRAFWGV
ncbi:hypothetical protein V6N13_123451 [Hibiscus sabdariffa]